MSDSTLAFNILTRYQDRGANKAARDMDKLGRSGSRMASTMKKAAAVSAVALGAGLVLGTRSLVGMTKAAAEDEKSQKLLARTLRNAAGASKEQVAATEKWISKQGVALGVADDQLRPALQRLTEATGSVGKAQKLTSLAMDVSAGTGKSLKTVSEALAKAQMGQVGALSRYGIRTRDATGKVMSFDKVVQNASKTFKGQASTSANTLEGKMGRLRLIFDETKEAIGARMIPIATRFADWMIADGIPAATKLGDSLQKNVLPTVVTLARFIGTQVIPRLVSLAKWVGNNTDIVVPLVAAIGSAVVVLKVISTATKVWAASQVLLNVALTANPIGIVVVAIAALAAAVVIAYKKSDTFRTIVQGAWKVIGTAARLYWNGYLKPVFTVLKLAFQGGATAAKGMRDGIGRAWDGIKTKAQSSVRWVVDKILWMAEKVLDAADAAFGWAPGIGDNLKKAKDKVAGFREAVNRELGKVKDESVKVTVKAGTVTSIGGLKLGAPSAVTGHAKGGPITGGVPGRDSVLAALMPNEHVLTTEEVRKAGGHRGVFAIRKMLREGKFQQHGDVPAFANGGPVFSTSTPGTKFLSPLQGYVSKQAMAAARIVAAKVRAILKSLGGAGDLSPAQIARGQRFARSQVGDPYVWGGVGPNGFDCSGFVGAVLNAAQGRNPYSRRGTTSSMPWPGFSAGPGSFSVGYFKGNPGHMAGRIGGLGIESAGGVGVRVGGAARSVSSFPHIAHFEKGTDYVPRTGLAVLHRGEAVSPARPTFQFNNCTFVGGSQSSFEDLLVRAYDNLRRKGRLP